MTKTYNDIDAVTKLLNEKEYDLELAARIGQALLQENLLLKEENAALNTHSSHTQEKVAQLMHEMKQKNEIIKMFFQEEAGNEGIDDSDESVFDISSSRPSGEVIQVLQYKVERLEQENQQLKSSAEECVVKTDYYEEREKTLLKDCVNEIAHTNAEARAIRAELDSKCTQLHKQQEEKTRLLAELVDIQKKYNSLTVEYEQVMCELETLQECTDDMAQEPRSVMGAVAEILRKHPSKTGGRGSHYWRVNPYSNDDTSSQSGESTRGIGLGKLRWQNRERVKAMEKEKEDQRKQFQKMKQAGGVNPEVVLQFAAKKLDDMDTGSVPVTPQKPVTYAQVASRESSRQPSMEDLSGMSPAVSPAGKSGVNINRSISVDRNLGNSIKPFLSPSPNHPNASGASRGKWNKRRQKQEQYYGGHSNDRQQEFDNSNRGGGFYGNGRQWRRTNSSASLTSGNLSNIQGNINYNGAGYQYFEKVRNRRQSFSTYDNKNAPLTQIPAPAPENWQKNESSENLSQQQPLARFGSSQSLFY